MKKIGLFLGFLVVVLAACNTPAQQSEPPSPLPTITVLPFFITETPRVTATLTPSNTPTPSDTPTPTETPTPITPTLTPSLTPTPPVVAAVFSNQTVNVREEPSQASPVIGNVDPLKEVEIHFLSEDRQWVFVRFVNDEGALVEGWINRPLLDLGDYIPPTQGPTATATRTGVAETSEVLPASGTVAPFVTTTPNGTGSPVALSTPSELLSDQNVLAYCRTVEVVPPNVSADDTVSIWWSWFVARPELMDDHLAQATYEVLLDGRLLSNYRNFQTPLRREDGNWYVYWYVPVGKLAPGRHEVTYRVTWDETVNDGYENFGPGTANPSEEGNCVFTVTE